MKKNLLAMVAVGLLAGPMAANAIPITYDFTVTRRHHGTAGRGDLVGLLYVDDSIIRVGGGLSSPTGLFTDLAFS